MKRPLFEMIPLSKPQTVGLPVSYSFYETPFGKSIIASTGDGICYIGFGNEENMFADLKRRLPKAQFRLLENDVQKTALSVIDGKGHSGKIVLYVSGTDFQLKVWDCLLRIPDGALSSYGEIARSIRRPKAARAVGAAVGANPISYLIPCHRVIRSDKTPGGYFWGIEIKKKMIARDYSGSEPGSNPATDKK